MKFDISKPTVLLPSLLLSLLIFAAAADAQSVIARATLGGYAEDVVFISTGLLKNQIAMIDAYSIYTVPVSRRNSGPFAKLCDLKHPELDIRPNGITYIESESLFAVNQATSPNRLYLFNNSCAFQGTRNIAYSNPAYAAQSVEGLAYIPTSAANFPDHLMEAVLDPITGQSRIVIMQRNGTVVSELANPAWPSGILDNGIGDITYLSPNRLLVAAFDGNFYTMDFSGTIVSGPITPAGLDGIGEGIVVLNDGRIVSSEYPQSLRFFDASLNRLTASDRTDVIGLNINRPSGVAWDNDNGRLLVTTSGFGTTVAPSSVFGIPTTLDSATQVVDLSAYPFSREAVYLPAEQLIGVLNQTGPQPRAILLFNANGTPNSQISLMPATLGFNPGAPLTLGYLPGSNEFLVSFNGSTTIDPATERRLLRTFTRMGAQGPVHDLTATGIQNIAGIEPFQEGGNDRLMIIGSFGRIIKTDLVGNSRNSSGFLFGEFNSRVKLGGQGADIALITTGPLAGAFAMVDGDSNEIVIFRL